MKMDVLIHGDSLKELKKLKTHSVDLLCTDPPYGYSFMGKSWDKTLPDIGIFKECFRVLKPGAFAFVMSAPRSDVCARMMLMLEDAGFEIGFTPIYWTYASGFPKAMNIGKAVDKRKGTYERGALLPSSRKSGPSPSGAYGEGVQQKFAHTPKHAEAKALDGSYGGFQPKPAVEVIIVAMKPLSEKTFVDQALKNGKGITWLDDCRVPTGDRLEIHSNGKRSMYGGNSLLKSKTHTDGGFVGAGQEQGRFPANLLVSDDVLNDGTVSKSQGGKHSGRKGTREDVGEYGYDRVEISRPTDSGSYSRYFDLDAWAKTLPFLIVPKAAKSEKGKENKHPTVKPLKLMSYLITLGSRPGDVILDPFLGSGTTALAAQQLDRRYIGIEREVDYIQIAKARLKAAPPIQKPLIAA